MTVFLDVLWKFFQKYSNALKGPDRRRRKKQYNDEPGRYENVQFGPFLNYLPKAPAIKKFMPLVVIIEAHDSVRNFWIW